MTSFLDPAILFFASGVLAGRLKSKLEIPPAISRFLSLYLSMALGLLAGFALAESGLIPEVAIGCGCVLALAVVIALLGYALLSRIVPVLDAVANAAIRGSVGAVTFITAVQYRRSHCISYGGQMADAMALMELPAVVLAVLAANLLRQRAASGGVVLAQGGAAVLFPGAPSGLSPGRPKLARTTARGAEVSL